MVRREIFKEIARNNVTSCFLTTPRAVGGINLCLRKRAPVALMYACTIPCGGKHSISYYTLLYCKSQY